MTKNKNGKYPMRFEISTKMLTNTILIVTTAASAAFWFFNWHDIFVTKPQMNLIFVELRLKDTEVALSRYMELSHLSEIQKLRYHSLEKDLKRLGAQKDEIIGLSK